MNCTRANPNGTWIEDVDVVDLPETETVVSVLCDDTVVFLTIISQCNPVNSCGQIHGSTTFELYTPEPFSSMELEVHVPPFMQRQSLVEVCGTVLVDIALVVVDGMMAV